MKRKKLLINIFKCVNKSKIITPFWIDYVNPSSGTILLHLLEIFFNGFYVFLHFLPQCSSTEEQYRKTKPFKSCPNGLWHLLAFPRAPFEFVMPCRGLATKIKALIREGYLGLFFLFLYSFSGLITNCNKTSIQRCHRPAFHHAESGH